MKVIVPLAGKGTRLLPLTNSVPKPLIKVAGRPVMDYVVDKLTGLDVDELIFITGHLKDQVEHYVRANYKQPARFIEQKVQDGTAGAVNLARPFVDGPVMIIFVDTVFDADLSIVKRENSDGIIWVKDVEDYQRFGVVVTDQQGYMTKIVEKPQEPISRLANIGLYYMKDWKALYEGVAWTLTQPKNKGEYFLTDAFQHMIDHGKKIRIAEVGGWYDCGKVDTILSTQEHLLRHGRARQRQGFLNNNLRVVDPVRIEDGVQFLGECSVGPNVTIGSGSVLDRCTIAESVIGDRVELTNCRVKGAMIGDGVRRSGESLEQVVAAGDETAPAR